jgi:hypothetical protein
MAEREAIGLWWQKVQAQARQLGVKDDDIDEGVKYVVEVPGISDVIHLIPRAKISEAEMKAHRAALRRHEPSPLSGRQLDTLEWKRKTWLKIQQSPTPAVAREAGWYLNQIENVGDMMTAAYWGGKGLLWMIGKVGLAIPHPVAKIVGWALTAKDVADVLNLFRMARVGRPLGAVGPVPVSVAQAGFFETPMGQKKMKGLRSGSLNPFSKESKLSRGFKLKAKLPSIPDWIEIAQVTDQLFGVGISFGAIVGFASDVLYGIRRGAEFKAEWPMSKSPIDCAIEGFSGGCALQLGP